MRPIQSPPEVAAQIKSSPRRRLDLTLPLPQRDDSLAVPSSGGSAASSTSFTKSNSTSEAMNYSDLVRGNRIGSGAGGTVYKAVHRPTSRLYALKVIYGNHEETVRRQICREIKISRDFSHPNVVKCHEMFDHHNNEIQVLLEFMDKGSLEGAHVWKEQQLSDLSRQILSGLAYLHGRHIVHRDIKPSNLLINSSRNVKIATFGVSRILDPWSLSVGTIAYMSPERMTTDLNLGQYDGYAGDIWSLGVTILEFYLGKFPFPVSSEGDWASLICAICNSQPPEAPPAASQEFRHFISCCLEREPARRRTALQLLQHPFIQNKSPRSLSPSPSPSPTTYRFLFSLDLFGTVLESYPILRKLFHNHQVISAIFEFMFARKGKEQWEKSLCLMMTFTTLHCSFYFAYVEYSLKIALILFF